MKEFLLYLSGLPLPILVWLCATFVLGVSFSLKNYLICYVAIFTGGRYTQNLTGRVIDWVWLTSSVVLAIYLIK